MKMSRFSLSKLTLAALIFYSISILSAQEMDHHSRPTEPSTELKVVGLNGQSITLTSQAVAALPHKTVSVFNAHSKVNETYSGVPLGDLLAKVGIPSGEQMRGKLFLTAIVAEGTDHYSVLYALAEIDPSVHSGDVIVADSVNNQKLEKDGAFKLVSTEEKRPARWVRNLASLSVVEVKP